MDAYNNVGIDSIETGERRDWTFGRADGMQLGEQNTSETSKH